MLVRMIELRAAFDDFFGYLHETEGAKEFGDVKTSLVRPTSEDWFVVQCLVEILNGFSAAMELLSGDKYPTLVFALPVLRSAKVTLQNEAIFDGVAASVAGERFVDRALSLMHSVRRSFISLFNERFRGTQDELLWILYLDPRFTTTEHLSNSERAKAIQCVHNAAFRAAKEAAAIQNEKNDRDEDVVDEIPQESTSKKAKTNFRDTLFGDRVRRSDPDILERDVHLMQRCQSELFLYMSETTTVGHSIDPLAWWKVHQFKYPILAMLARKWLGGVATSVPSERTFSTAGSIMTIHRSSLKPSMTSDIIFIAENAT